MNIFWLPKQTTLTSLPFTLENITLYLKARFDCCLAVYCETFDIQYVTSSRQLYFVARFGVDGHPCVLRALCEAKERLKPGKSLVEDILHVVFT
jgi:hypothetical protein